MFSIGDAVVGNSKMRANENVGAVGVIEAGKAGDWHVRWNCGRLTYGIDDEKLFHVAPAVPNLPTDVRSIGEEIISTLTERGKQYDASGKEAERSMKKIVTAFNAITGQDLTAVQGWAFMQVLKQVRFFSNTTEPHRDSLIDNGAYALLQAEEALQCPTK